MPTFAFHWPESEAPKKRKEVNGPIALQIACLFLGDLLGDSLISMISLLISYYCPVISPKKSYAKAIARQVSPFKSRAYQKNFYYKWPDICQEMSDAGLLAIAPDA